jgi:hypothetical protein
MKINGKNFLIGADPELFLKTKDGVPFSAHGLIQGTKEQPFKVRKGAVQVDGMALEFNINPASGFRDFDNNISTVMEELRSLVPSEYTFDLSPSTTFDDDTIDSQPMEALELGCSPDFNAYTMEKNKSPHTQSGFRTAAGHIHIGWGEGLDPMEETHFEACATLAKQLDVYLGVPSILWDRDQTRRSLYGGAGAFRPKSYGMEYRTLSNVWVKDKMAREAVWRLTKDAITRLFRNQGKVQSFGMPIQDIINKNLLEQAGSVTQHIMPDNLYRHLRGGI